MINRSFAACCLGLPLVLLTTSAVSAQNGPQPGVIENVDREKGTVTITHGGKQDEFQIADSTRLMDLDGKPIGERLKDERINKGAAVFFKPLDDDPKTLMGLKLRRANERPGQPGGGRRPELVKVDTSSFKPLDELGADGYHGYQGGLYPGGTNERPADHEAAGIKLASQVAPLDAQGQHAEDGRIVLLTVGMSNTMQASTAFKRLADADGEKNPRLVIVNGAQGGMSADRITNPDDGASGQKYWNAVDEALKRAGVTREQVQVVWMKQAEPGPTQGFPKYAQKLEQDMAAIVRILPGRFPNVKLCYLSPRTYGGYAKSPLNPEPYAYESAFSIKWLIERQLQGDAELNCDPQKGPVQAPWLSWGAYLWANGSKPNSAGLAFEEADFAPDGTHESPTGQQKVGRQLLSFFKTDSTTKPWFRQQ
ncbi:MAG TPA: hypothetical protein VFI31_07555 [Pirellulales bacterium]|nr:hypothetical protein [Pirellulales bacterium]